MMSVRIDIIAHFALCVNVISSLTLLISVQSMMSDVATDVY